MRHLESAADELARLDTMAAIAPTSVTHLLQVAAVARLAADTPEAIRAACTSLVAARVELVHAAATDASLLAWQDRVDDGERRARSGAPLRPGDALSLLPEARAAIDAALRPGTSPRPLLWRALQVAAHAPGPDGEVLAALLLVAGGATDRLRVLPFAAFAGEARQAAQATWHRGDAQPFTRGALDALAMTARGLRLQLKLLLEAVPAEDAHLASIGRAAVTGRRVLAVLREALATSVPDLSQRLSLSRPAAGAALERLVELGLAEEITGRGRDRVFVYAGAWGLL